jgi:hypothetical protein
LLGRSLPTSEPSRGDSQELEIKCNHYESDTKAAVLRIWRRKGLDDDTEIQELAVFAINERIVCPYAVVDIHHPDANETAAHEAEAAADWQCTEK